MVRRTSGDGEESARVDLTHSCGLAFPVFTVVLENAKRVNPEEGDAQGVGEGECVSGRGGELGWDDADQEGLEVGGCRFARGRHGRAPAVTQGSISAILFLVFVRRFRYLAAQNQAYLWISAQINESRWQKRRVILGQAPFVVFETVVDDQVLNIALYTGKHHFLRLRALNVQERDAGT